MSPPTRHANPSTTPGSEGGEGDRGSTVPGGENVQGPVARDSATSKARSVSAKKKSERSQGSFLLARVGLSQTEIAARVGVKRESVSMWLSGTTKPGADKRALLEQLFQIPTSSWDEAAVGASIAPPVTAIPKGVLEKASFLESMVHATLVSLQTDAKSTPAEKAKVMASAATTLGHLAKLTGEYDLNTRFFKLPVWHRIEQAVADGLRGHPEAARAVAAKLREVEDEHARSGQ